MRCVDRHSPAAPRVRSGGEGKAKPEPAGVRGDHDQGMAGPRLGSAEHDQLLGEEICTLSYLTVVPASVVNTSKPADRNGPKP